MLGRVFTLGRWWPVPKWLAIRIAIRMVSRGAVMSEPSGDTLMVEYPPR